MRRMGCPTGLEPVNPDQRLVDSGVEITTPLQTEPWGERFLQVTDPNGIVIQLVQWVTSRGRRSGLTTRPIRGRLDRGGSR